MELAPPGVVEFGYGPGGNKLPEDVDEAVPVEIIEETEDTPVELPPPPELEREVFGG